MSDAGFSKSEMMIVAAARALEGQHVCFVGVGLPNIAVNLAQRTVAPDLEMVYEAGVFGARPQRLPLSLGGTFRAFWRHPSPWMITATLVGTLVARVVLGDWRIGDLWGPVALVALFPVLEWLVHVFVLHWRPRDVAGITLDTLLSRKHREHHADPRDVPLVFIPWQALIWVIVGYHVVALLAFPRIGQALSFLLAVAVLGLLYEWTHYLIHSDYKPRSRAYRAVWRNHRLHHYKNEHYWFTVTSTSTADRLFGTYPDPATVETSPTAKNLHGG